MTYSKTDKPEITSTMATEDTVGIQTRAMTEAQHMENEAQQTADNNQEEGQRAVQDTGEIAQDPAMNPVVEIHKNDDVIIEEYVQRQGGIGLDWYVPDFANTQVKEKESSVQPREAEYYLPALH